MVNKAMEPEEKKRDVSTWIKEAYQNRSEEDKAIYKERKRVANLASWSDPVIRAKRLAAMAEARNNPEKAKRVRDAILESNKNPEHIKRRLEGKAKKSPEEIALENAQRAEAMEKAWADPESRQRMLDGAKKGWSSPEKQAKLKELGKRLCTDPAIRKKWKERTEECHNDPVWKADFTAKVKAGVTPEVLSQRGDSIRSAMAKDEYVLKDDERIAKMRETRNTEAFKAKKDDILQKIFDTKMARYGSVAHNAIIAQTGVLREEEKVRLWLTELGHEFKPFKLKSTPFFLDGFCEKLNLAFEYCGLYWHNENSPTPRGKDYHLSKMEACNKAGIRLITIFEDEWTLRRPQVQSFLRSVVGSCERKVFARKCLLKEIEKNESRDFLNAYHIQGASNAPHSFGIFFGEELLGVMTFAKHHRNSRDIVLSRLCFKTGCQIIGGASRLFSFAQATMRFEEVISWSDNRWSEGGVYKALGFTNDETLGPDYTYFSKGKKGRISKQSQMKSKTGCPEGMTEKEWAKQNGLSRIWDCGKIRWKWKKPE